MPLHESMCDVCMSPGHCCKELTLSGPFSEPMSRERAEHLLISPTNNHEKTWVFRPLRQDERGIWRFSCTQLLSNGRCGIYEDRPHLCRHYQPGTDALCVHFVERSDGN